MKKTNNRLIILLLAMLSLPFLNCSGDKNTEIDAFSFLEKTPLNTSKKKTNKLRIKTPEQLTVDADGFKIPLKKVAKKFPEELTYRPEGKHHIAEFYQCNEGIITNFRKMLRIMKKAAKVSGADYLGYITDKSKDQRLSCTYDDRRINIGIIVSESHFTIHIYPEYLYCQVDAFTCGTKCDNNKAITYLKKALKAKEVRITKLTRGIFEPGVVTEKECLGECLKKRLDSAVLAEHHIVELYDCDFNTSNNVQETKKILDHAAQESGIKSAVDPFYHQFNNKKGEPQGVSGLHLGEKDSHLSIHTWPEYGYCAIDILTNGKNKHKKAIFYNLFRNFKAKKMRVIELSRGLLPPGKFTLLKNITQTPLTPRSPSHPLFKKIR